VYAPIVVSGATNHDNVKIGNVPISFIPDKSVKNNSATKQSTATSNTQGLYSVKLTPGTYNVTVKKTEGVTTVYSFTGKLSVYVGEGTATYDIDLTKESVTVRGSTTYDGLGKANMTIFFTKDTNVQNNTAITKNVKADSKGNYTIELTPGTYNVTVEEIVNESGVNFTYTATSRIVLNVGDTPRVFNIVLTREKEL
jgi:hypothetical protein